MAPFFIHSSIFYLTLQCFVCLSTGGVVIKDPETMVSQKQVFKLGFFTPANTTNRYLGVFFAFSEETVIWVANRENPLKDSSGTVTLSKDGNLLLMDGTNQTLWSTNLTTPMNSTVQVLDTGNLVLRDVATGDTIWESFSQPTSVMVPGMKLSHNVLTGKKVSLSSWKSANDPGIGSFTGGIGASIMPQLFVWNGGRPRCRSGQWNGRIFIGVKGMYYAYLDGNTQVKNDSAGNFIYTISQENGYEIETLNSSGSTTRKMWNDNMKRWDVVCSAPENDCDVYGTCGQFGSCNSVESPICSCLRGFEPVNEDEWESGNWTNGCRRRKQLQCDAGGGNSDGFARLKYMKVPDFALPFYSRVQDECRSICLGNCSCIAYAYDLNIGCMFWDNTLIDVQEFGGVGVDLYIRLSASELDNNKHTELYILIAVAGAVACISILIFIAWWLMVKKKGNKAYHTNIIKQVGHMLTTDSTAITLRDESKEINIGELPKFTFEMLATATDHFHENNLLGRGGFGPVYEGTLANGKKVAVKRLSADSGQGKQEFMNEVMVISKLQHRNLVKLLGGCVEKEEKILIYEYLPNKSLDACLFGPGNPSKKLLDWTKRYSIIEGIGRGILYLHRDSRLRIIHRDLKPSNVLLDENWNPKISDFGMARIFGGNEDHGNTARVVGTYGYMSPEYAMEGRFSEKSDVYSFGVLMLEIMRGTKNTHYFNDELSLSLSGYAWKLWSEGNGLGFVDEEIASSELEEEMVRCIHIGLLCVQDFPYDRPNIQTLLAMLTREIMDLPPSKPPLFVEKWNASTTGNENGYGYSNNGLSLTELHGR